jgi:hypothetical protein
MLPSRRGLDARINAPTASWLTPRDPLMCEYYPATRPFDAMRGSAPSSRAAEELEHKPVASGSCIAVTGTRRLFHIVTWQVESRT